METPSGPTSVVCPVSGSMVSRELVPPTPYRMPWFESYARSRMLKPVAPMGVMTPRWARWRPASQKKKTVPGVLEESP